MEEFFKELIVVYKKHVRIRQLKRQTIQNFCRFYISFVDQHKDPRDIKLEKDPKDPEKPKDKKDKYLQVKKLGLQYITSNQDLIYSEINK
jgi:hypothetical protein